MQMLYFEHWSSREISGTTQMLNFKHVHNSLQDRMCIHGENATSVISNIENMFSYLLLVLYLE